MWVALLMRPVMNVVFIHRSELNSQPNFLTTWTQKRYAVNRFPSFWDIEPSRL